MADESLKQLLDAEAKAELVVARADEGRRAVIEQAQHEARLAEQQHAARVAEIHASFLAEAEQRAQQTIAGLQRQYAERSRSLRDAAERVEQQALAASVRLITGLKNT